MFIPVHSLTCEVIVLMSRNVNVTRPPYLTVIGMKRVNCVRSFVNGWFEVIAVEFAVWRRHFSRLLPARYRHRA